MAPTKSPTNRPTVSPTVKSPTTSPTKKPTAEPTTSPTDEPTPSPTPSPTDVDECHQRVVYHSGPHAELIPKRYSDPLFYLDVTGDMTFELDVTVNAIPPSCASVFHCGNENKMRMPGIWLHADSDDNGRPHQGFTVVFSTIADTNKYSQRATDKLQPGNTYHLEIKVTQNSFVLMMNDKQQLADYNYGAHHLHENVPCYLGDPWYVGADVVVKHLKVITECPEPTPEICHTLEGNPSIIWGDPHTITFAGVKHDFQGQPQNGLDQFYYIHPCHGYGHDDLPYNVIGRHYPYRDSDRVSGLDYLAIELFDADDHRYVAFFNSAIHGYAMGESTVWENVEDSATMFTHGTTTMIGSRFKVHFVQNKANQITVTLTVDHKCKLEFTMIGQYDYSTDLQRYTMHYVRMNPPECYKCAVCGLYGNFKGYQMQTCDGNTVTYGGYTNAWDERGWTWEKTYTNQFCEITDDPEATPSPTSEPYVPPPDPTFPYDPCDDESSTEAKS